MTDKEHRDQPVDQQGSRRSLNSSALVIDLGDLPRNNARAAAVRAESRSAPRPRTQS